MITNNTIIAFECFHKIHQTKNGRDTHCAYKLDLAKAYDRVDWRFLEEVVRKVGFCCKWTSWVMQCVRSVRYSVKCNGELLEPFNPSRSLARGPPQPIPFHIHSGRARPSLEEGNDREQAYTHQNCKKHPQYLKFVVC